MSYIASLLLYKANNPITRRWIAGLFTAADVAVLGLFKYYDFFLPFLRFLI